MRKYLLSFILFILTSPVVFANTPPQVINKTCSVNQFFNKIAPGPGNITCLQPTYSGISNTPSFADSVQISSNIVTLVNDLLTPGNSKYYGTNASGTRGFFDVTTDVNTIGTFDSATPSANGAVISTNSLVFQSASTSNPGMVNNTTQSFSGNKTFTGSIGASNLSGTNTGDVTLGAVGSSPNANGASLSGQVLTLQPANGTNPGSLTAGAQNIGGAKNFVGQIQTGTPSADAGASVLVGNTGTGADQKGLSLQTTGTSAATGSVRGIQINLATAAAAFTAPQVLGINVQAASAGAGSTITRAVSYFATPQTVGATGNAEFADNLAFSGNFVLNFSSANASSFAGPITASQVNANSVQVGSAANTINGLATIINTGTLTLPTATDTLVGRATTDTLTNKTLTGNTAANLISGAGTLTLNTTGTMTVPSATDTLVGKATTDTLTNKSISGSTNTLTNIGDGSLTTPYIKADGTRGLSADWNAGLHAITANSIVLGVGANTIGGLSTITNGGTLTLPTATDTLVARATTDILTNKVLTGNTAVNLVSGSGTLTLNTTGTVTLPNATDTLVGKATSDVLINKTLTGNTAVNLISGAGTLTLNTTGTITVPSATDTLVGKATTDQLSGKTFAQNVLPEANNTRDLGATATRWANLWLGGNATVSGNVAASGTLTGSNFSGSSSGTNTGDVTIGAFGSTPNSNGLSLSGQAINLQPADGTNPGSVSTTTQTFAGAKTFSGNITGNGSDNEFNASASNFFRVSSTGASGQTAQIRVQTAVGGGSAFINFAPLASTDWSVGEDSSDGSLKFDNGASPGSNTRFSMTQAGVATFPGSVKFATSGGTPTALSYYEEGTFTANFNAGAGAGGSSTSNTVSFVRIGKTVTLLFPSYAVMTAGATASTFATAASTIPSRIAPGSVSPVFAVFVKKAGTTQTTPGILTINTDGSMSIGVVATLGTNWTSGDVNNGFFQTSVSYTIQ